MLKPLKQWICDTCREIIEKPEDGYVIWKEDDKFMAHDFRIIHAGRCDKRNEYPASRHLMDFLGSEGLAYLLYHLSLGPILEHRMENTLRVKNLSEFVDLIRRVQTPYYEEARQSFSDSDLLSEYYEYNEYAPYLPRMLKAMIKKYPRE